MKVERANEGDIDEILTLFDASQEWLAGRGLEGQWGTEPFSQSSFQRKRFAEWIAQGEFYVGRRDGAIVGTVQLSSDPPQYARRACHDKLGNLVYLEALTTNRAHAGEGLGRELLRWAEERAAERGRAWLLLDCWAQNEALRSYYRGAGFQEVGTLVVGTWQGTLFEKRLLGHSSAHANPTSS